MPNLINSDGAGNTFYNYITPVIKGESLSSFTSNRFDSLFTVAYGAKGTTWNATTSDYRVRFPDASLAGKSGNVSLSGTNNVHFRSALTAAGYGDLDTTTENGTTLYRSQNNIGSQDAGLATNVSFAVANSMSFVTASFKDSSFTDLVNFVYIGALREPSFTGATYPLGIIFLFKNKISSLLAVRVQAVGATTGSSLSTAADAITSPPIVCTPGTTPGVGTATFTDVVIRDAAAPNNPVGKLWNCIDMPATCNVGELWKNTGNYDADGSTSNQDVYLCVMPWGERKLGMRVWTENVA